MYSTTGLTRDQIVDLCAIIQDSRISARRRWPPTLGLFDSVRVALIYLRRNRTQVELAEQFGVSQPTISRAVSAITP
ncbi:transposase family protein, partial [Actinokineospora inagensis]|uniref:transposase family protein n=1 Tax=Actinokineospora inagensis TaxID=103730 RepID=UPI00146FB56B